MAVSNDTAYGIYQVLSQVCSTKQIRLLLEGLAEVPGNQSFRDTLNKLRYIHARKSAGELKDVAVPKEEEQGGTGK